MCLVSGNTLNRGYVNTVTTLFGHMAWMIKQVSIAGINSSGRWGMLRIIVLQCLTDGDEVAHISAMASAGREIILVAEHRISRSNTGKCGELVSESFLVRDQTHWLRRRCLLKICDTWLYMCAFYLYIFLTAVLILISCFCFTSLLSVLSAWER